ncbi:TPA: hypothetical protein MFA46_005398 [Klebsiella pneumoniae]|nr:hypothetical protein [Klebsiella pneumoniae]HCF4814994.1 hypothetical protein [Pseudomonas aeruginosa]HBU7209245.1 hypothetical protein [Klebsiella pneumoniae]HBU7600583.1 hypothetical protein [Klebsiella pneumoniae]HBU8377997.1 hypothetical protein [Klebsiella pneumoniae]
MSTEGSSPHGEASTNTESVTIDAEPIKKNTKVTARKGTAYTAESEEQRRSFIDSEDAKETVVWFIIKFTLTLCGCITAGIFFIDVIANKSDVTSSKETIEDIKSLWEIFFPIITLSLGYLFGKSHTKSESSKQ